MTYTEQCIKLAIEQGWHEGMELQGIYGMLIGVKLSSGEEMNIKLAEILLDKSFFQALGRGLGWGITDKCWGCGYDEGATSDTPIWKVKQHRLIDHINEGHSIEEFFKSLIVNK